MNIPAPLLEYPHIYNITNHTITIDQHFNYNRYTALIIVPYGL